MVNGSEFSQDSTGGLPPKAVILQIIGHTLVARALAVAVDLGVPDLVRDAPRSADEIAETTGSHPAALYRLLRMLASHGVFEEDETGRFHTTPIAACLESDRDGSLRHGPIGGR